MLVHRVRGAWTDNPMNRGGTINAQEKAVSGIDYARIRCREPAPGPWQLDAATTG